MSFSPPGGMLGELLVAAREELATRRRLRPGLIAEVQRARPRPRGFTSALARVDARSFPLICEVKRASPSAGALRSAVHAPDQATAYVRGGARCISVLTETRHFAGSLEDLAAVRGAVEVPLLRKDFLVDPYMVFEAAAAGADAVLLIVAAVDHVLLDELAAAAGELALDVLWEVVSERDLDAIARHDPPLVGINARDLETLQIDRGRFGRMAAALRRPGRILVAESGVAEAADLARVVAAGADAALVGESLMRAVDPEAAVRQLVEWRA